VFEVGEFGKLYLASRFAASFSATIGPSAHGTVCLRLYTALENCLCPLHSSIHRRMPLLMLLLRRHCCYDVTALCIVCIADSVLHPTYVTSDFNSTRFLQVVSRPRWNQSVRRRQAARFMLNQSRFTRVNLSDLRQ